MKKFLILIALSVLVQACENTNETSRQEAPLSNLSTESAEMVLTVADKLQRGEVVSDADWNALFKTKGYQAYLIYSDSVSKKAMLRETLELVFNRSRSQELDSLLAIPVIKMNAAALRLITLQNIHALKLNLDKARTFLDAAPFEKIVADADSIARAYLPPGFKHKPTALSDTYFISADPDGMVTSKAIVIDLQVAIEMNSMDLSHLIAHEFHHNYRALSTPQTEDPFMSAINKVHQEGIADLIDKDQPPVSKLGLYPKMIIDLYNNDYFNTPTKLAQLDDIVVQYSKGEIDDQAFSSQISRFFLFGGHTNGFYMSSLIKKELGIQALIETFDNPVAFFELYIKAARSSPDDHQLSTAFQDFIESKKGSGG